MKEGLRLKNHWLKKNQSSCGQGGYTLIEMMTAAALGIFVTAGAITLYSSNKNAMRLQANLSEVQKNGRFLIDRLSTNIQNAGYSGFYERLTVGLENALVSPTDSRWNLAFPVYGFDNVTAPPPVGISTITANTDVLLLKSMTNIVSLVNGSSANAMSVNVDSGFVAGDLVIATDQDRASVFQAMTVDTTTAGQTDLTIAVGASPAPGNAAILGNSFGTDAQVGKLESLIYFVSMGNNGRTALFEGRLRRSISSPSSLAFDTKELISDVENMQIVYGIDTDADENIDNYGAANTITANNQWSMVRNVGVTLLLSSSGDQVSPDANSYSYSSVRHTFTKDNVAASGADYRLRRVFTMHVAMPNM